MGKLDRKELVMPRRLEKCIWHICVPFHLSKRKIVSHWLYIVYTNLLENFVENYQFPKNKSIILIFFRCVLLLRASNLAGVCVVVRHGFQKVLFPGCRNYMVLFWKQTRSMANKKKSWFYGKNKTRQEKAVLYCLSAHPIIRHVKDTISELRVEDGPES